MDCLREISDMVRGLLYRTNSHQYEQLVEDQLSEQQPTSASESGSWPIYSLPDQMNVEEPSAKQPATNEVASTTALEKIQPSDSQSVHATSQTPSPNECDLPRSPDNALLPWVPHWFALEDTLLPPEDNPTSTEDPPSPSEQTPPPSEKASLPSEDTLLSSPFSSPLVPSLDHDVYRSIPKPRFPIPFSKEGPRPFSIDEQRHLMRTEYVFWWDPNISWRIKLDTDLIKKTIMPALELLGADPSSVTVAFLDEGGFNTVFTATAVDRDNGISVDYIVRIPLPVDPYYKMECEVATTEFIRHFTSIPVPKIYAYDSSNKNPLGLEWMIMEKIKGADIGGRWLDMDNANHTELTVNVAQWVDEMSRLQCDKIGGLYLQWTNSDMEFFIGPSISHHFTENRRLTYNVNRGPFESIWDYYDALIDVQKQEFEDPVLLNAVELGKDGERHNKPENYEAMSEEEQFHEDELSLIAYGPQANWTENTLHSLKTLQDALQVFRSTSAHRDLVTYLIHRDISLGNLLVDENDRLISLLDWEHTEFLPDLSITLLPVFLNGEDLHEDFLIDTRDQFGTQEEWNWLADKHNDVITSHLRPIFKESLEQLQCCLVDYLEPKHGVRYMLKKMVFDVVGYSEDIPEWVEEQLEFCEKSDEDMSDAEEDIGDEEEGSERGEDEEDLEMEESQDTGGEISEDKEDLVMEESHDVSEEL